jgi:hypothetical protein
MTPRQKKRMVVLIVIGAVLWTAFCIGIVHWSQPAENGTQHPAADAGLDAD